MIEEFGQKLYTPNEAGELLKFNHRWIRKKVAEKKIKGVRIGNRLFIPEGEIVRIMNEGC